MGHLHFLRRENIYHAQRRQTPIHKISPIRHRDLATRTSIRMSVSLPHYQSPSRATFTTTPFPLPPAALGVRPSCQPVDCSFPAACSCLLKIHQLWRPRHLICYCHGDADPPALPSLTFFLQHFFPFPLTSPSLCHISSSYERLRYRTMDRFQQRKYALPSPALDKHIADESQLAGTRRCGPCGQGPGNRVWW